jgi:phosphoglycolate phosphatase
MPTLFINQNPVKCKLAIFDMDGTIIDVKDRLETMAKVRAETMKNTIGENPTKLWAQASGIDLETGRVRLGYALTSAPRREDLIVAATVIAINGEPWGEAKKIAEEIYSEADKILASTYRPILLPCITETLMKMKDAGIKLALATNAPMVSAMDMMESVGLKGVFDEIIGSNMVENVKPAPDMILLACERCRCRPDESVYFGDMPMDMIAGRRAEVAGVFAIKSEFISESEYQDYDELIDTYNKIKILK